jgi:hypothetical protein
MTYQAWFAKALVTMTIAILVSGGSSTTVVHHFVRFQNFQYLLSFPV